MVSQEGITKTTAVVIHIHYVSTAELIAKKIKNSLLNKCDIYITLTPAAYESLTEIKKLFPNAKIASYENKGRDIRPFFKLLKEYEIAQNYDFVLKLHGKKTKALPGYGAFWLVDSLNKLIPTEAKEIDEAMKLLSKQGVLGPTGQLFNYDEKTDKNDADVKKIINKYGLKWSLNKKKYFFGGSMLWFSSDYLSKLQKCVSLDKDFQDEKGQYDATFAHAVERAFTIASREKQGQKIFVVDFQNGLIRNQLPIDVSVDGLIRDYEEFSRKAVLVSMGGQEYVTDYLELKELQQRKYEDISSEQAIRTVDEPDNVYTLLIKTQEELSRIKASKKYRLLEKFAYYKSKVLK